MSSEHKINPDAEKFLELIRKSRNGKFKIYIGLAAGVGKTYRMLQEAHDLYVNNVDVLIGYVETHKRAETEKLLAGLPVLPRKTVYYKGKALEEFDVDKALRLRPEVIIVDELAHENVPGSRNRKRYQDIEELLFYGINVISAMNIQHIESLNGVVREITGIDVKETVPDRIVALADEVVNIDLTADELISRLRTGKIYSKDKIESALANFFKKENLLQLRELALREVADQVEKKISHEVPAPERYETEKILVCIGNDIKQNEKIIRQSSRMADRLNAVWYVIYVETPSNLFENLDLALQRFLINNFKMASELGASAEKVKADTIAKGIRKFAEDKEITKVVMGRPDRRFSFKKILRGNVLNKVIDSLADSDCDLEIIT